MNTMKMHTRNLAFCALLPALLIFSARASDRPPIRVPLTDATPVLDGVPDDACWDTAWVSPAFYDFEFKKVRYTPNADTTVQMLTDGQWLYLAIACRHPDAGDMHAKVTENFGGNVYGDECIKIFLNPGLDDDRQVFRYVLNFNNAHELKRMLSAAAGQPAISWPSATQVTPAGWTAELAIPLFDLAGYGDLKDVRLNIFRKKVLKKYDQFAVEIGLEEQVSTLAPTTEWTRRSEMAQLTGLDAALKPDFPLVVNAGSVTAGELREADGQMCYDVNLTLQAMTTATGTVEVAVIEKTAGAERRFTGLFPVNSRQVFPANVEVPVAGIGQRDIDVVLLDPRTRMPFQTWQIRNASGFEVLHAMTRLNYYTSEADAAALYEIGMPENILSGKFLVIRGQAGQPLARQSAGRPKGAMNFPITDIPAGRRAFNLALEDHAGSKIFDVDFEFVKCPPAPGREWKIDRARGGMLLRDGQPFFPLGFCMDVDDAQYREIAAAGFNTVLWWTDLGLGKYPQPMTPDDFVKVAELAGKHGLMLMVRPEKTANRAAEMASLKKYFPGGEHAAALAKLERGLLHWKYLAIAGATPWNRLTRAQRNEIAADWMGLHLPLMLANVRAIREMPSLMAYNTLDEPPEFREADLEVELTRMTDAIREVDPYRPVFVIYSSKIPEGAKYTDFADALGTDPYWIPGGNPPRGSINWVSCVTARTVKRAREKGLLPWTVPMSSLWSASQKRMISGPEQICQSYLALIHGTRGIIYFTHGLINTAGQWQGLKTVAERINAMTPALAGPDPEQEISYTPGNWAPLRDEVPDVQCRLMRFPDGRYVLLAANVRRSPVEISAAVKGLADTSLNDLFDGKLGMIKDGAFVDTLPARGVRSYVFSAIAGSGPVRISIVIAPQGTEGPVESGYDSEGRIGFKNILPNPSFEMESVAGWPDYYIPHGPPQGGGIRIGAPGAAVGLTTNQPFHGEKCLYIARSYGNLYWKTGPQLPAAQTYVFSFYARTASADPVKLWFQSDMFEGEHRQFVEISGNTWRRYHLRVTIPARYRNHKAVAMLLLAGGDRIQASGPIFLDALQLESGLEPTEFEP